MFNTLKIYIILSALILLCCSCSANNNYPERSIVYEKNAADQSNINQSNNNRDVQKFLGYKCLGIINNPDKVETYQIDRLRNSNHTGNNINSYPVTQKGHNLDNKDIKAVRKIINSSSSYDFKWSKRIRIRPSHVLRFIRYSEKVDITIDFNTRQWAFYHDNKVMTEDISKSASTELNNIISKLF
ncbi:hypothetical protein QUF70_01780 [Desulfobacterales bacterium HSG17]|nr:hypothetical protein [Desulfobacterales bacterium HSG17]